MKAMLILFKAEFKRFWTAGIILTSLVLIGIGSIVPILMGQAGVLKTLSQIGTASFDLISLFALLIFYSGIVASDVKSGWLRTLLIRTITRQQYVSVKMFVAWTATLIVYCIVFLIPVLYLRFVAKIDLQYNWNETLLSMLLIFGQSALMVVLSTTVSCSTPGMFNSIFVVAWMILSQIVEFIVNRLSWDRQWAVLLKDYIFPSGFSDALKAINQHLPFPYAEITWGFAALTGFLALAFFSINQVIVDSGSE